MTSVIENNSLLDILINNNENHELTESFFPIEAYLLNDITANRVLSDLTVTASTFAPKFRAKTSKVSVGVTPITGRETH